MNDATRRTIAKSNGSIISRDTSARRGYEYLSRSSPRLIRYIDRFRLYSLPLFDQDGETTLLNLSC